MSTNILKVEDLVNNYPLSSAVISKLVTNDTIKKNVDYSKINYSSVSNSIIEKIRNNDDIIKLFPDTELAMQIVVTSIISPNDLTNTSIKLEVPDIPLPSTIKSQIVDVITDYITENYSPISNLYTIIKEALFTKGAYVEICIPESSLDRLINSDLGMLSIESYTKTYEEKYFNSEEPKSILSLESLEILKEPMKNSISITPSDLNIEFTEDLSILKFSDYKLKKIATENSKNDIDEEGKREREIIQNLFRTLNNTEDKPVDFVLRSEETMRENLGVPFITKVPVECVIPIYSTNDHKKHVGYFLILDQNGNFLDIKNEKNHMQQMGNCNNYINSNFKDMIIDKSKRNIEGQIGDVPEIEDMESLYNDVIEELIKNRMRNSKYEDLVDISKNKEIYKVMLNRALKNKKTKVLFVPNDLVQYYAFNYRNNGTGESLIEKSSALFSMAGLLLMGNIVANIQNAIPQTEITVTIDEEETDLTGIMAKIQDNILKLRQSNYPIGVTDFNALVDWVQRAGLKFNYDNPNLPNTKIEMQPSNLDKPQIDQEFLEMIIGMINKSFGVTPEMVDAGKEKEFATSIVADNMLFARRVINWQVQLEPMVTKHIKMILNNDSVIKDKIANIINNSKKEIKDRVKDIASSRDLMNDELEKVKDKYLVDYIIEFFFNKIQAKLARPEYTDTAAMNANYDNFVARIEKLVDLAISDQTFIGRYYKGVGENIQELNGLIKFQLIYKYITNNNLFPELVGMAKLDENGQAENPVFSEHITWTSNIIKFYNSLLKELFEKNKNILPEFSKLAEKFDNMEGAESGGGFGGDFGGDDSGDDGMGDDGGGDDMGGDMDDFGDDDVGEEDTSEEEEDIEDMTVEDAKEEKEEKEE